MMEQRTNKETIALSDKLNQMGLNIYRIFHPKTAEFTFFSSAHETFSRIDHMSGHKTIVNKFKKIEIVPNSFQNAINEKLTIKKLWRKKPYLQY